MCPCVFVWCLNGRVSSVKGLKKRLAAEITHVRSYTNGECRDTTDTHIKDLYPLEVLYTHTHKTHTRTHKTHTRTHTHTHTHKTHTRTHTHAQNTHTHTRTRTHAHT